MSEEFIEVKSTDNQPVYLRRSSVAAMEVIPASARVEGHIKVYVGGFKFNIQGEIEELM